MTDADAYKDARKRAVLTDSQHKKVLNIAQDMITSITNMKMPKNIGLALHVLSMSYNEAQGYITALSDAAEEQIQQDSIFIQSNVVRGRFTQYAIDNLDFCEFTKDGTTMHSTTYNIYQHSESEGTFTPASIPSKSTRQPKS